MTRLPIGSPDRIPEEFNMKLMHDLEEYGLSRYYISSILNNIVNDNLGSRQKLLLALVDVAKRVRRSEKDGVDFKVRVYNGESNNEQYKEFVVSRTMLVAELLEEAIVSFGLNPNSEYTLRTKELDTALSRSWCLESLSGLEGKELMVLGVGKAGY